MLGGARGRRTTGEQARSGRSLETCIGRRAYTMKTGAMVLGLIGAFIGLPASVCAGACAAGLSKAGEASDTAANAAGGLFMFLGLVSVVLAIVGAIVVMKKTKAGGILLMVSFLLAAVTCVSLNPFSILQALLLLIAGILGLAAKAEAAAPAAP